MINSLKYYYNIFGDNFKYQNEHEFSNIDNSKVKDEVQSTTANVVSIRVCSDPSPVMGSFTGTGLAEALGHHSWIQVHNLTSNTILVGGLYIEPLKGVTIGTWQGPVHDGIFYNYECYAGDEFSTSESVNAVQLLSQSELNTLNEEIVKESNDKWSATNNCSAFAARMWNTIADYKVSAGIIPTPVNLTNSILNDAGGMQQLMLPTVEMTYYGGANPKKYRKV